MTAVRREDFRAGSYLRSTASWVPLKEHTAGIIAQVAASLPLLLVTIWIARSGTLEDAGRFTVVVGVSAAAYSTAQWGLRTAVVIDQFRDFSPREYLGVRATALLVAGVATVVGGLWMEVSVTLILIIVALRSSDALADLWLAFAQVRFRTELALKIFAVAHLGKLALVILSFGLALIFPSDDVGRAVLGAAAFAFLGLCVAGLRSGLLEDDAMPRRIGSARWFRGILNRSKWFAIAVVACALLTSAPRIVVPALYQADLLGVVGVSLSVGTFFGMVFFTAWLRNLPRFEAAGRRATVLKHYCVEWLVIGIVLLALSRTALPPIVAAVFGFPDASLWRMSSDVLAASVVFSAGMTLANLYKLTPWPWMESVVYALPLVLLVAVGHFVGWPRTMPALLVLAGGLLFLSSLPALARNARSRAKGVER